jgi:hypothetical protein
MSAIRARRTPSSSTEAPGCAAPDAPPPPFPARLRLGQCREPGTGAGSFTDVIKARGRRIVVFDADGVAGCSRTTLRINNPDTTIDGQAARSPGVSVVRGGMARLTTAYQPQA